MQYREEKYTDMVSSFAGKSCGTGDAAGTKLKDMSSSIIENAVPGYWEDMTEKFMLTPFSRAQNQSRIRSSTVSNGRCRTRYGTS